MSTTNQNSQSEQAETLTQQSKTPILPNNSDSNQASEALETNRPLHRTCGHWLRNFGAPCRPEPRHLLTLAASASGSSQPLTEAALQDTDRPAHHCDRPSSPMFRHEAEFNIDSFAK